MLFTFVIFPAKLFWSEETSIDITDNDNMFKSKDEEINNNNNLEIKLQKNNKIKDKKDKIKKYLSYHPTNIYTIHKILTAIPFHYQDIFKTNKKSVYDVVSTILNEIIYVLPENFDYNDLLKITTKKQIVEILDKTDMLNNFHINKQNFIMSEIKVEQKISDPNYKKINDIDDLLPYISFDRTEDVLLHQVDCDIKVIQNILKNLNEFEKKYSSDKYTGVYETIMDYKNDYTIQILTMYYALATKIIYIITFSKEIEKVMQSELYEIYIKLKEEEHNEEYIFEKIYSIYESLYKNSFEIEFDLYELRLIISIIDENSKINNNDNQFVNINNTIIEIDNVKDFRNINDEFEVRNKIIEDYVQNIICYSKNLTFDEIIELSLELTQNTDRRYNNVKKEIALQEKNRILNGEKIENKENTISKVDFSLITNGYEFEEYIAYIYSKLGYEVTTVTKKSGDQGVDVIMKKDNVKYAIQVKYYNNPVGNKAIQEVVAGKQYYYCDKAMVVTNSSFTKQAEKLALSNDVILIDGIKLEQLKSEITI